MAAARDLNAHIGGLLGDLASIQTDRQKSSAYRRASAAVLSLEHQLSDLAAPGRATPRIPGLGPSSWKVVTEVLATGGSPTVEAAVAASGKAADVARGRTLREHIFSRAEVRRVLADPSIDGCSMEDYRGDLQMHSVWSDGAMSLPELALACANRGYDYAAVTDHSHGLAIARGMSREAMIRQHAEIDGVNKHTGRAFRLLKGVEANIDRTGALDLSHDEVAMFDIVLAAPHARLRAPEDQTARMIAAVETPGIHILAHPRGRKSGTREGIVADWDEVFARAAALQVAVEIDGDPARQDLDYALAARARDAGCLLALDSDAHSTEQLWYAETAVAHARLAGIPVDRIVNTWPLKRLLAWTRERRESA